MTTGNLPGQLTSFIGRDTELAQLRGLIGNHRLVTLTGTGGVGKTRLAQQLALAHADAFADGTCWVGLAALNDPDLVSDRVAHALSLPDQPGRPAVETLTGFIAHRRLLLVLDNCEHLLDGCATLITALLGGCTGLTIITTSREPLALPGELIWPTPPLALADEAIELFTQRARLVRPDFTGTGDDADAVAAICRHLDGVPLAIELAATRVRALSLPEIADGLRDRFALLRTSARTVEGRQRSLYASVDWSHNLLSEPERVVFRRLAVFAGGFDLDAAQVVVADADPPAGQIVEALIQLVDKSLVVVDNARDASRYQLLETIRHYAWEKLDESGEADAVQARHRDHYSTAFAAGLPSGYRWQITEADIELDNLRAAFTWSREHGDIDFAAQLASSLLPLWIWGHSGEGLAWFAAVLVDSAAVTPAVRARALADKAVLEALSGSYDNPSTEQAVTIARGLDDPALLAWTLAAYGSARCYRPRLALPCFTEAIDLAPALTDDWRLAQIYAMQAYSAFVAGDLSLARAAAERGRALAEAVGDWAASQLSQLSAALAYLYDGDLAEATERAMAMVAEGAAAHDQLFHAKGLLVLAGALTRRGDASGALAAATGSVESVAGAGGFHPALSLCTLTDAALAAGDIPAALTAGEAVCDTDARPEILAITLNPVAKAALAAGEVSTARRRIDESLAVASGVHRMVLLEIRVRVAIAEGAVDQAERDARDALAIAVETGACLVISDVLECLATLAAQHDNHREAARLLGSAAGIRERTGATRFAIYDADYTAVVDTVRETLGTQSFADAWAEGAALSTQESIAQALPGRPSSGWAALTPAERDVVRLVSEGLRNKDIAAELLISPRTVQTHLTRVYAKLDVSSRVQLAQEAAAHTARADAATGSAV